MLYGQLGIVNNHHIKIERLSHFHSLKSCSDDECSILLSFRALKFVWIFFDLLHEPAHHHGGEHYIVFQVEADQHLKLDVIQNPANFLEKSFYPGVSQTFPLNLHIFVMLPV